MNGRSSSLSSNSRSNVKKDIKPKKSKKRSSSSSSSGSSSLFSDSYSDSFSSSASLSHNDKEDKSKLKNGILRRSSSSLNSRRTTSSLSKNDDSDDFSSSSSLNSARTNLSKAHSLKNLEIEYEPVIASNLSFNVYQALFSIKASNINIYNLKKEYQENEAKIKTLKRDESQEWRTKNDQLVDKMIAESVGAISLVQVIYGSYHWKLAKEHTNLALVYLEFKHKPKQAKYHCEKAWSILVDDLKQKTVLEMNQPNRDVDEFDPDLTENDTSSMGGHDEQTYVPYQDFDKHQMLLNYIYGRSCALLKQTEEAESALDEAKVHCDNWEDFIKSNKGMRRKYRKELNSWKLKIYLALAKQSKLNGDGDKAVKFYDLAIEVVNSNRKQKNGADNKPDAADLEKLIEINVEKSKVETGFRDEKSFLAGVDLAIDAIKMAEDHGSQALIADCKFNLAKIYAQKEDMNSSNKAEDLLREVIDYYSKVPDAEERSIKTKDELINFYLKKEKYEDACQLLLTTVKEKIDFYSDYSPKINPSYKLLCSVYLVKNDMPNAAIYLKKSLEIEELNYGTKDKRYLSTKETLDNLKKNPNVQSRLKETVKTERPAFSAGKKIDYSKSDYKLYSREAPESDGKSTMNDESLNKKIIPLK